MRQRRIIIPGISVVERMSAEAMHAADKLRPSDLRTSSDRARTRMDALLTEKAHRQQSELSWLREIDTKIAGAASSRSWTSWTRCAGIGVGGSSCHRIGARVSRCTRGLRFTAQAFQQMGINRALPS